MMKSKVKKPQAMVSDQSTALPPCVRHEDEHLLVVDKPAGWNTHAPSPYAGEGMYDWLKQREPRWANLAIIHRLDKETSGLLVFGKTPLANRSLTEQFARRAVRKKYLLLTDRPGPSGEPTVKTSLLRAGDRYVSGPHGELAETRFKVASAGDEGRSLPPIPVSEDRESREKSEPSQVGAYRLVEAVPLTGRTHQIRVHAAECGFPVLGDRLYGGTPFPRVCLHAAELAFQHPATGTAMLFQSPPDFAADTRRALRNAIIEPESTNAFRRIHGAGDGWPGCYVDQLGDFVLAQGELSWSPEHYPPLSYVAPATGIYHKTLSRHVRRTTATEASPRLVQGQPAPERFAIREYSVQFELSFTEGYSIGLFLDQRDNRRRLRTGHIAANFDLPPSGSGREVLNTFAYTCGFSVCAALGGARTTSLDLSKKYLDWGKRNFTLNGLDRTRHDFIYGDTFDWLRRLAKKDRVFDVIILDPPTFSQSKESGVFRAEKDYRKLVTAALPLLTPGGVLLASTNAAELPPERFLDQIREAVLGVRRTIVQQHYVPQPPDFPISRAEPAYLKTVWLRVR